VKKLNTPKRATAELLREIDARVQALRNYTPKIGVFGNSGVGKSSLCNELFGKPVAKISDVEACTRKPQEILIGDNEGRGGMVLVDVPGIGEDPAHHQEYTALYESLAPNLDLVLWTIKADDRNYASGLEVYNKIFRKKGAAPVVFVITQVDKTNPHREWDVPNNRPGENQLKNIAVKENDVSRRFDVPTSRVISVAAHDQYNLKELVSLVVEVLPKEKKFSFAREAKPENVAEDAQKAGEKGIWDSVKELAGSAWDLVKEHAATAIIGSAPKLLFKVAKWIKSWF